eukprot:CAMPEP_0183327202 /NCGR_PEP_ID=MMETSP0160_2-20130417/83642_1 /TAXON_ID=2839 ORGANISM="Odontella Sinensis, Strain Grunow 1884" /NCGR_SAMPLE_ID=MMETSP0160_2 /ASSEMBLY_ACC=CAM_ASM_000250 /LENGTH=269 /DNA_ID=CAMNT_0025495325 /DNA_START=99 /DNA_END=909 /DNA_ORIENTATION=-
MTSKEEKRRKLEEDVRRANEWAEKRAAKRRAKKEEDSKKRGGTEEEQQVPQAAPLGRRGELAEGVLRANIWGEEGRQKAAKKEEDSKKRGGTEEEQQVPQARLERALFPTEDAAPVGRCGELAEGVLRANIWADRRSLERGGQEKISNETDSQEGAEIPQNDKDGIEKNQKKNNTAKQCTQAKSVSDDKAKYRPFRLYIFRIMMCVLVPGLAYLASPPGEQMMNIAIDSAKEAIDTMKIKLETLGLFSTEGAEGSLECKSDPDICGIEE